MEAQKQVKVHLNLAIEKNLAAIALTDHDGIGGIERALAACRQKNAPLQLIPGIELSTGYAMPCRANRKYHNISEDESANMYIVIFVDKRGISFDEMFVEKN